MKNSSFTHVQNAMNILLSLCLFSSCSQENLEHEENVVDFITADAVYNGTDCSSKCLFTGGYEYYVKGGTKNVNVGPNEKEMSYSAYNTEDSFVVNVTYEIVEGKSGAQATISVLVGDNERVFENVVSGTTVTHTVNLPEGWAGCDAMEYFVRQEALGDPVEFSGSYNLIPVCNTPIAIGQNRFGGIITYIFQEGDPGFIEGEVHGLVAATEDLGAYIPWSNSAHVITNASETALGTGMANTLEIVAVQGEGTYAARLCNDLVLNGYDDWFLPSSEESGTISTLNGDDNFRDYNNTGSHWTSSEVDGDRAIGVYLIMSFDYNQAIQPTPSKTTLLNVRAMRYF